MYIFNMFESRKYDFKWYWKFWDGNPQNDLDDNV